MARGSPTLETLAAFAAVFVVQRATALAGVGAAAFALTLPLDARPWTLVLSVYAHASVAHLAANSLALLVAGLAVERSTTRLRFHAFFVTTGAIAGVAQVTVADALGPPVGVLGASGAVLAVFGYLLASNALTERVVGRLRLGVRLQLALLAGLAALVTWATSGPGVALVAHFTGVLLGAAAGRLRLLRAS